MAYARRPTGQLPHARHALPALEATRRALSRRQRKAWSPDKLAGEFDRENLMICRTCNLVVPDTDPHNVTYRCPACDDDLVPWVERQSLTTYEANLIRLRQRAIDPT